ncbi:MAG: 6-phosphofructokinase [bacterium]|nr:6-phosphofructokinase [bacterium]
MKEPKVVAFQGGGPTAVINWTLIMLVLELWRLGVRHVFGARYGAGGILKWDMCDFGRYSVEHLLKVAATPGAALGSSRDKYTDDLLSVLMANGVTHVIGIGGGDTAKTLNELGIAAQAANYELTCIHGSKTHDNDIRLNYVCPGYPSSQQYVAEETMSLFIDTEKMRRIHLLEVMGRDAGWDAAAAARAPVDVILLPERPVILEKLIPHVADIYSRQGWCLIAMSEGIIDPSGVLMRDIAGGAKSKDLHGNRQLSGSGRLMDWMCAQISEGVKTDQVRGGLLGYSVRSSRRSITEFDVNIAKCVGEKAAEFAMNGKNGSAAVTYIDGKIGCRLVPLEDVAGPKKIRRMEDKFIDGDRWHVTPAFLEYLIPMSNPLEKVYEL